MLCCEFSSSFFSIKICNISETPMQALIFMLLVFCCIKHFLLAHLLIIIIFVISCVCALNKACAIDEIDVRVWSCWFKYFTPKHIESLYLTATGTKYKQRSSKNRTQNKIRNKKRESKIDANEIMNVSFLFLSHDLITKQARQGRHASSFVLVLIFCCSLSNEHKIRNFAKEIDDRRSWKGNCQMWRRSERNDRAAKRL